MFRKSHVLSARTLGYIIILVFAFGTYFNFVYPHHGTFIILNRTTSGNDIDKLATAAHSTDLCKNGDLGREDLNESLRVLNIMGRSWTKLETLEKLLQNAKTDTTTYLMWSRMSSNYTDIEERAPHRQSHKAITTTGPKTNITIAFVSCGSRRHEAIVMLKSVTLFSQDSNLHVIMFGDNKTIVDMGQDILALKWTVNALGWDFTYELHLEWFPANDADDGEEWRQMYTPCATERLFFPSLLPHIDSLIYLDTDIIMVSNMTEFWLQFKNQMGDGRLAAMAPNNEETATGWYNTMAKTPYYGKRGLNAGVMLMNLTQMRDFGFQQKSKAAHTLYREKLMLADQDIVNIIFHEFPEKLHELNCSYNFNWVHCGHDGVYDCHNKTTGEAFCFCKAVLGSGIQAVHGNSKTFHSDMFPFLGHLFSNFKEFNLLTDSPKTLFENLKKHFKTLKEPCEPLTAEMMYDNAEKYLRNLESTDTK